MKRSLALLLTLVMSLGLLAGCGSKDTCIHINRTRITCISGKFIFNGFKLVLGLA